MAEPGELPSGVAQSRTQLKCLSSKITADGDCSLEIKGYLLLGRKSMTNLDKPIKKQRHYFAYKGPYSQSYVFSSCHVQMWELDSKKGWAPKNRCLWIMVLEKTRESLGLQGNQTSQSTLNIYWKDWCWSSNILATWCKELTHLTRPWCWETLKAGGEGDNRGWDGWMASPTHWTWVCANSRRW